MGSPSHTAQPLLPKESSSRFNLESLKSQTGCWHWQVGTGRAEAQHQGLQALPWGSQRPRRVVEPPTALLLTPCLGILHCCTPAPATLAGFRDGHPLALVLGTRGCPLRVPGDWVAFPAIYKGKRLHSPLSTPVLPQGCRQNLLFQSHRAHSTPSSQPRSQQDGLQDGREQECSHSTVGARAQDAALPPAR